MYKGKKADIRDERVFLYGLAMLWLCVAIHTGIIYYRNILQLGYYNGHDYIVESDTIDFKSFLSIVGGAIYALGLVLVIIALDLTYIRTKYILTGSCLFLWILILINFELMVSISMVFGTIFLSFFLWFSFKARKEYQAIASVLVLGFLMNAVGINLLLEPVLILNIIPPSIPVLFMIAGVIIFLIPIFIELKAFNKRQSVIFWSLLLIVSLFDFFFFFHLLITYESLSGFFIQLVTHGVVILVILIHIIKYDVSEDIKDTLTVFSRPKKLTEEEVSISKEKKICLVCKGSLGRLLYLCPDCDSFYCKKCSDTLATLENACWVCETPFDESKPVNLADKREEKELQIEAEPHKKGK